MYIAKSRAFFVLLNLLFLSACTHTDSLTDGFSNDSQAVLYGWVTFDEYIAPIQTSVDVEVCQVVEAQFANERLANERLAKDQCIVVAKQEYKGVQLPVQYSFVIAPIQAGKGEMKVRAVLRSQGKIKAKKEERYVFTQGNVHKDLNLHHFQGADSARSH